MTHFNDQITPNNLSEGSIVPIYKEKGITSHGVVDRLRTLTGIQRIGHAGTLDPMAEGVLVVGIGRSATKQLGNFLKLDKEYRAEMTFGLSTDTYDAEGRSIEESDCWQKLTKNQITEAIKKFIGLIQQLPPPYSAKKIAGRKAYDLARRGQKVELKPAPVTIYAIKLLDWQPPRLTLDITCSSGTYIRSIAHDLGQTLHCPAHLSALTRTRVGKFIIENCIKID